MKIDNNEIMKIEVDQFMENNKNLFKSDENKNIIYLIGLIDYFETYNNKKKMEFYFKKIKSLNLSIDSSVQNPRNY